MRYSGPRIIFLILPTGIERVPETAAGLSCARVAALSLGTTDTQSLADAMALAIESARHYAETRQQAADLSALYTVTRMTSQSRKSPTVALTDLMTIRGWALTIDLALKENEGERDG